LTCPFDFGVFSRTQASVQSEARAPAVPCQAKLIHKQSGVLLLLAPLGNELLQQHLRRAVILLGCQRIQTFDHALHLFLVRQRMLNTSNGASRTPAGPQRKASFAHPK
jgi:hypothetical protein